MINTDDRAIGRNDLYALQDLTKLRVLSVTPYLAYTGELLYIKK